MAVTRSMIEDLIKRLNEAENSRPNVTVDETIARVDAVMADDVEGWTNGVYKPNREAERQGERLLLGAMADYHRDIERVVIDPPFAAFTWRIKGASWGKQLEVVGCSVFEVNSKGKARRYWMYVDTAQWPKPSS